MSTDAVRAQFINPGSLVPPPAAVPTPDDGVDVPAEAPGWAHRLGRRLLRLWQPKQRRRHRHRRKH